MTTDRHPTPDLADLEPTPGLAAQEALAATMAWEHLRPGEEADAALLAWQELLTRAGRTAEQLDEAVENVLLPPAELRAMLASVPLAGQRLGQLSGRLHELAARLHAAGEERDDEPHEPT